MSYASSHMFLKLIVCPSTTFGAASWKNNERKKELWQLEHGQHRWNEHTLWSDPAL